MLFRGVYDFTGVCYSVTWSFVAFESSCSECNRDVLTVTRKSTFQPSEGLLIREDTKPASSIKGHVTITL
jgi:hypothetical protein